jgi:hypothetical protein
LIIANEVDSAVAERNDALKALYAFTGNQGDLNSEEYIRLSHAYINASNRAYELLRHR